MGLPIGLFLFQLWGCPASALSVAGNGGGVLLAHPFFGTVDWCLFETLLFPSYATRCRYNVPGVLASGSGLAASAFFFFFFMDGNTERAKCAPSRVCIP